MSIEFRKCIAFTLAEVLITLGIIGVVAAMTIPTLMNNIADAQYKTAYKKAYSVANQAILSTNTDGLLTARTTWDNEAVNRANFEAFKSQFRVAKSCDPDVTECWDLSGEKAYSVIPTATDTPGFIDSSGFAWIAINQGGVFTGGFVVDTNGFKRPNQYGKDRFLLLDSPDTDSCTAQAQRDSDGTGLPSKICPWSGGTGCDLTTGDCLAKSGPCPSGNCYYTSWITGAK